MSKRLRREELVRWCAETLANLVANIFNLLRTGQTLKRNHVQITQRANLAFQDVNVR